MDYNSEIATLSNKERVDLNFELAEDDELKIEAGNFDDPLKGTVPTGKIWTVSISVDIIEADAPE